MRRNTALPIVGVAVLTVGLVTLWARGDDERKAASGREVTLVGQVLDLHGFMTEKYKGADKRKCTAECIRSGVPAVLNVADGPYLLGKANSTARETRAINKTLIELAYQRAEVRGKVYRKGHLQFLDVASVRAAEDEDEDKDIEVEDEDEDEVEDEDEDEDFDDGE